MRTIYEAANGELVRVLDTSPELSGAVGTVTGVNTTWHLVEVKLMEPWASSWERESVSFKPESLEAAPSYQAVMADLIKTGDELVLAKARVKELTLASRVSVPLAGLNQEWYKLAPAVNFAVPSQTDANVTYMLTVQNGRVTSCSCPDYALRRARNGDLCKHMRAFIIPEELRSRRNTEAEALQAKLDEIKEILAR